MLLRPRGARTSSLVKSGVAFWNHKKGGNRSIWFEEWAKLNNHIWSGATLRCQRNSLYLDEERERFLDRDFERERLRLPAGE